MRSSEGAAAVEFALLLPLFVLLVFGMISAGQGYFRKIAITQAAREGSRYGSTLPIPPTEGRTINDWLDAVRQATINAGGINLSLSSPVPGQWVCVAYVAPQAGGTQTTESETQVGASAPTTSSQPCWDDSASGATQARVQVEIRRSTEWNLVVVQPAIVTMDSKSVTDFERQIP